MFYVERLSAVLMEKEKIPDATQNAVLRAVFDLVVSAVGGCDSVASGTARIAAPAIWGNGAARGWFGRSTLPIAGAAFLNSTMAAALDLDDGHRDAAGHPGAAIIPAVLATSDVYRVEVDRCLTAIAIGYEVAVRIAASRDFSKLDTLVTGLWCGQGVAAAVAYMRELTPIQTAHAIAIAGTTAPTLASVGYTKQMGNQIKEGIPWATVTGLAAVDLAVAGCTGPLDILDSAELFSPAILTEGLGSTWAVETLYFKPYSCCRWAHAAIDAALQLQADHALESIKSIHIETFERALRLNNEMRPSSLESAQYSLPFCIALALTHGPEALLPMTSQFLSDPKVLALVSRVSLQVDNRLDAMFSKAVPARVTIETTDTAFTLEVLAPKGEPSNPLSWGDLATKADRLARALNISAFSPSLLSAVRFLGIGDGEPLRGFLSRELQRE